MRMTKRLVCLLAALLIAVPVVALPATALGQSAGDDQYVDPFQNNDKNDNGNSGSGSQSNDNTSASQQTTEPTTTTGDTAGATAQDPSASGTLPRTGEDLGGVALMGVILVGGGFALRRAWPLPE
jgi:LPXTG-motif cell wall-anchored protein